MAKINFNFDEFEDEEIIVPSPSASGSTALVPTQILPPAAPLERNQKSGNKLETFMGGLTPMGTVVCIARSALDTVLEISRCIATVSMEKQRTKQVKALANIQIEASKQQTERVRIEQREETTRYRMQCETALAQNRIELEKFVAECQQKDSERSYSHQEYMASLDKLEKRIDTVALQLSKLNEEISLEMDTEKMQVVFHHMEQLNATLVELSKQIVNLRRR